MRFTKVEGLGNDFVLVDRLAGGPAVTPQQSQRLCDRHRGVGADGVLVVWPQEGGAARMQILNADGSDAGMCGNGLRCVARYLYHAGHVPAEQRELILGAVGTTFACRRVSEDVFAIHMGAARTEDPELPPPTEGRAQLTLQAQGRTFSGWRLSMDNPHFVVFVQEAPIPLAQRYGPALESHPSFVARANISFVRVHDHHLETVVYERGVGITQACGSGACAVGAAAVMAGHRGAGEPLAVELPGGTLRITVDPAGPITMEGPAHVVFAGDIEL